MWSVQTSDFFLLASVGFVFVLTVCLHQLGGSLIVYPLRSILTTVSPVIDSWYDVIVPFPRTRVQSHFTVHEKGGRAAGERVSRGVLVRVGEIAGNTTMIGVSFFSSFIFCVVRSGCSSARSHPSSFNFSLTMHPPLVLLPAPAPSLCYYTLQTTSPSPANQICSEGRNVEWRSI